MVRTATRRPADAAGLAGLHGNAADFLDDNQQHFHHHVDIEQQHHDRCGDLPRLHVGCGGGRDLC